MKITIKLILNIQTQAAIKNGRLLLSAAMQMTCFEKSNKKKRFEGYFEGPPRWGKADFRDSSFQSQGVITEKFLTQFLVFSLWASFRINALSCLAWSVLVGRIGNPC